MPATPKARRAALRAVARFPGVARRLTRAPSEAAALSLRAAPQPRAAPRAVLFLIPLVARFHVGDWPAVTARLNRTLESFRAQEDGRWLALICTQERPPLPDDPRIRFLPFADAAPGNDKWRKLARLCDALPDQGVRAGYAMSFDADDLLRRGAVAEMLGRQAPGGYLARTGYVHDVAAGLTALAAPPTPAHPLRKPFWKLCGSCAALRFDLAARPGGPAFLREMVQHEHRMFPHLAALAGQPLTPLARPSVMYLLNHGENFGARRGRTGFKTAFVRRYRIAGRAPPESDFPACEPDPKPRIPSSRGRPAARGDFNA